MKNWNPDQYAKFLAERTRPARDLVASIAVADARRVVDVGCGPGNSAAMLRERWPQAQIEAFDSSQEMLAKARASDSQTVWFQESAETWRPEAPYDVIFSNAVLHWVPQRRQLLPQWFEALGHGGALAVQIPAHFRSPLHIELLEQAKLPRWRQYTADACERLFWEGPEVYYQLLSPHASRLDIWETCYWHVIASAESIIEMLRSTGLRPFLDALPDDALRQSFEAELLARYRKAYPPQPDGRVLMPFNRFFFVAYR